jgi:hypothetical protein
MKERPITFTAAEVRATREGRKTQFRRVVKPQPDCRSYDGPPKLDSFGTFSYPAGACGRWACPYGHPGDRLWVRETFAYNKGTAGGCLYKCDYGDASSVYTFCLKTGRLTHKVNRWQSPVTMPREHSRILLEIQSVRVERLQEITEEGAKAEGITDGGCLNCGMPEPCGCKNSRPDRRDEIAHLWGDLWHENPWVRAVEFRVVEGGAND